MITLERVEQSLKRSAAVSCHGEGDVGNSRCNYKHEKSLSSSSSSATYLCSSIHLFRWLIPSLKCLLFATSRCVFVRSSHHPLVEWQNGNWSRNSAEWGWIVLFVNLNGISVHRASFGITINVTFEWPGPNPLIAHPFSGINHNNSEAHAKGGHTYDDVDNNAGKHCEYPLWRHVEPGRRRTESPNDP